MKFPIRFYCALGVSAALLAFLPALGVSAALLAFLPRSWRFCRVSAALLAFLPRSWRFCRALGVSAAFRVILTKISKRSGNAVQWNWGIY